MPNSVVGSRALFRDLVTQSWAALLDGNTSLANKKSVAGDSLADDWAKAGRIEDLLGPLLDDEAEGVRFAAASHLLTSGLSGRAIEVLLELQSNPRGPVAPVARLRLMLWRKRS